ncbi:MAG TPA: hypothetical protein VMW02_01085 [Thermoplasmata archaeon]|nr:hypothetical protein [Thermoplasmata archaeon]
MYKLVTFSGYDTSGPHIFPFDMDIDRTIGHIKMARPLPPQIEQYMRTAKPIPGKTQLLIDAMGAGEFYGSNVNGDYFPEAALSHDGPDYGHKTFELYAYPFKHHVNKDPARAYGEKVTLAAYDSHMHRVLLIVSVDDTMCQDILGDLAANKYWDVSMGCRVPWDECSICKNRAKNRAEYCPHLRYQMNKILQDGRRVFAYNHLPKFFDISFVTIGAEKASHVLKKVAHANGGKMPNSAVLGELYYAKLADQEKRSTQKKEADIDKDVPSQPSATATGVTTEDKSKLLSFMDDAGEVKCRETPIPAPVLDRMSEFPLSSVFSTLTSLGIGLRPNEFQRIILVKQGARALADKLASHRLVFDETKPAAAIPKWAAQMGHFSADSLNEKIAMLLTPYIRERSCYPEVLLDRLRRMEKQGGEMIYERNSQWYPMTPKQERQTSGIHGMIPASMALAAGFLVFRKAFPEMMARAPLSIQSLAKYPWLLPLLIGAGVATSVGVSNMTAPQPLDAHGTGRGLDAKNTRAYHEPKIASISPIARVGMIPLAYMYSGIQQKRWQRGERLNALDRMIALRPELLAIGSFAAAPRVASGIKNIAAGLMKSGSESIEDSIINSTRRLASR